MSNGTAIQFFDFVRFNETGETQLLTVFLLSAELTVLGCIFGLGFEWFAGWVKKSLKKSEFVQKSQNKSKKVKE